MPFDICSLRKHSTDGYVEAPGGGRPVKIQVFKVTCLPHRNFMSFKSKHKRDAWVCPGHHIEEKNK